jgi:hypothetical protein
MPTKEQIEKDYLEVCRDLGDIEVVLATYNGIKNNLLIKAGELQRALKGVKDENISQ